MDYKNEGSISAYDSAPKTKSRSLKPATKKQAFYALLAFLGGCTWFMYGIEQHEPFATFPKGGPGSVYLGPCGKKGFDCGYVMYVYVTSLNYLTNES